MISRGRSLGRVIMLVLAVAVAGSLLSLMLGSKWSITKATSCANVSFVYARGSGELARGEQAAQFQKNSSDAAKALGITNNFYELGAQGHENEYNPVGMNPSNLLDISTIMRVAGARVSKGYSHSYGESVDKGVTELKRYLEGQIKNCTDEGKFARFILAGYSQGAQVIGDTLKEVDATTRSHVLFNGLMGDPKLNLPEGVISWHYEKESDWFRKRYALACRGDKDGTKESYYSKWRRDVPNCETGEGSLFARKPYIPEDSEDKVGLWCNEKDLVCGSSLKDIEGHGLYGEKNGPLWKIVHEGLLRYMKEVPVPGGSKILDDLFAPRKSDAEQVGPDEVVLVNAAMLSTSLKDSTIRFIRDEAQKILSQGGRVTLAMYTNSFPNVTLKPTVSVYGDFSKTELHFEEMLTNMTGSVGATREYTADGFRDALNWRYGAKRNIEIYNYGSNLMMPTVLDMDVTYSPDVSIAEYLYPVVLFKRGLATSVSRGGTYTSLVANDIAISGESSYAPPKVITDLSKYYTSPGEAIYVDASDSYGHEAEIVRWDWDFESDGTYDITYGSDYQEHTYTKAGEYTITIRAWDSTGATTIHHVPVQVGENETIKASDYRMITSATVLKKDGKQMLVWEAINEPTGVWGIRIDGMLSGSALPEARSIELDLGDNPQDYEVSIVPISAESELGETFIATNMFKQEDFTAASMNAEKSGRSAANTSPFTDTSAVDAENTNESTKAMEREAEEVDGRRYDGEVLLDEEKSHKEAGVAISLGRVVGGIFVALFGATGATWYWRRRRAL